MVSHKHKFLYVPIIKTGTTSIVNYLRTPDIGAETIGTKHWFISDL